MSEWTHSICTECYKKFKPGKDPVVMKTPDVEACCFCGAMTDAGIYYRADPSTTLCKGKHD